jgi:hypothetical protein
MVDGFESGQAPIHAKKHFFFVRWRSTSLFGLIIRFFVGIPEPFQERLSLP